MLPPLLLLAAGHREEEEKGRKEEKRRDHLLRGLIIVFPWFYKGNEVFSPLFVDDLRRFRLIGLDRFAAGRRSILSSTLRGQFWVLTDRIRDVHLLEIFR